MNQAQKNQEAGASPPMHPSAKAYLRNILRLDAYIEGKLRENEDLHAMATRITPMMKEDVVSGGGGQGDKIADAVAKIVDLQEEINRAIDQYADAKREAAHLLEKLKDPRHYTILHGRYILDQPFEDLAKKIDYSLRGTFYLHGRALQAFQKILDEYRK